MTVTHTALSRSLKLSKKILRPEITIQNLLPVILSYCLLIGTGLSFLPIAYAVRIWLTPPNVEDLSNNKKSELALSLTIITAMFYGKIAFFTLPELWGNLIYEINKISRISAQGISSKEVNAILKKIGLYLSQVNSNSAEKLTTKEVSILRDLKEFILEIKSSDDKFYGDNQTLKNQIYRQVTTLLNKQVQA